MKTSTNPRREFAVVPRPSPKSGTMPRLVDLPSADLVEIPHAKPPSVPPPLPPRPRSAPPPSTGPVSVGGDVVVGALAHALRGLDREPDMLSGARLCLDALSRVISCRAALVHVYDAARGDFVVVGARGEGAESMLLVRSSKDDPLLRIAMERREAFAWEDLRRAPVARLRRFSALGHMTTALVIPIIGEAARSLGAIELVDPLAGGLFRSQDVVGARWVAQRLAELAARCGLVTEVGGTRERFDAHF